MKKIFIVDDNLDYKEINEIIFRESLCKLTVMTSGAEILTYLNDEHGEADAVILDLSMPTLDGLTVAQEIRRNEALHPEKEPVHIAFFTARNIDAPIVRVAEKTNVERIFTKPVDPVEFVAEVEKWLDC